jgi:two-component system sensor histidine kinase NreB
VDVNLTAPDGTVLLKVNDDGCGFDSEAKRSRLGLDGMAERAKLVGGELRIDSMPGDGTSITLEIPQQP